MTPNYEFGGETKGDLLYRYAKEPRTPPEPPAEAAGVSSR